MAHVWLDKVGGMTAETQSMLKEELASKTIVGEYIGSPDHEHLVKYSRVSLIFYSVVENNNESQICWPCLQARQFLRGFGLDAVTVASLGKFTDFNSLCDMLETQFKEVSKSPISKDEEGSVLYFETVQDESTVLSLAKLKTLEYRLFRKMREKLRNYFGVQRGGKGQKPREQASKQSFNSLVSKFVRESKDLCEDGQTQLPRPFEFYVSYLKSAFDFVMSDYNANTLLLQHQFVTFAQKLLAWISKNGGEKVDGVNFFYSDILERQQPKL